MLIISKNKQISTNHQKHDKMISIVKEKEENKKWNLKIPPPEEISVKANKHKGFTLSEVLITLVIIGVVAAITVPILMNQYKWKQYRSALMKARSTLDQATIKYAFEYGENPECGYWAKNPYYGKTCTPVCKGYDEKGHCKGSICSEDGSELPDDYNGYFGDCKALYNYFLKAMNVIKICDSNAYSNGCIPEYEGNDTLYKSRNDGATDSEIYNATNGCDGWRQERIKSNKAFVTGDGMIFFPYSASGARIIAVDINGQAGPNKWGYDVFAFEPKINDKYSVPVYKPGGCAPIENGGVAGSDLLYNKKYM